MNPSPSLSRVLFRYFGAISFMYARVKYVPTA